MDTAATAVAAAVTTMVSPAAAAAATAAAAAAAGAAAGAVTSPGVYEGAPRYWQMRSTSPKTPPAVTSRKGH